MKAFLLIAGHAVCGDKTPESLLLQLLFHLKLGQVEKELIRLLNLPTCLTN